MFFPNNGLFITFFRQNLCLCHPEGPLAVNYEITQLCHSRFRGNDTVDRFGIQGNLQFYEG